VRSSGIERRHTSAWPSHHGVFYASLFESKEMMGSTMTADDSSRDMAVKKGTVRFLQVIETPVYLSPPSKHGCDNLPMAARTSDMMTAEFLWDRSRECGLHRTIQLILVANPAYQLPVDEAERLLPYDWPLPGPTSHRKLLLTLCMASQRRIRPSGCYKQSRTSTRLPRVSIHESPRAHMYVTVLRRPVAIVDHFLRSGFAPHCKSHSLLRLAA